MSTGSECLEWVLNVPNLTDHITDRFDHIDCECDHIIKSAASVGTEIDRLNHTANDMNIGLAHLAEAKAILKHQRMIIFRRLFLYEITPSAIKARISRILHPAKAR